MKYQIITDSCCDFTEAQYREFDVSYASLTVTYNGESHNNFSEESAVKGFYDELRGGVMASTAAANPEDWTNAMEPALKEHRDVLVLAFSSGLSTTYQSAVIAAEELREKYPDRKIYVADTLSASLGEGLLVWYACKKRDEGMDIDSVYRWVEENKLHLCHWFTVDDLMYLKRGGRVSAATALVGTMLQIKPVLHVDNEGHLINKAKTRGRKASIEALAEKMRISGAGFDNRFAAISHGDCRKDAEYLAQLIKERCGVEDVLISYVGAVIGSHSGPGTVALFFLGDQR